MKLTLTLTLNLRVIADAEIPLFRPPPCSIPTSHVFTSPTTTRTLRTTLRFCSQSTTSRAIMMSNISGSTSTSWTGRGSRGTLPLAALATSPALSFSARFHRGSPLRTFTTFSRRSPCLRMLTSPRGASTGRWRRHNIPLSLPGATDCRAETELFLFLFLVWFLFCKTLMRYGVIPPASTGLEEAWKTGLKFTKFSEKYFGLSQTVSVCDTRGVPIQPEVDKLANIPRPGLTFFYLFPFLF
jgi:hypothetical protein